MTAVYYDKPRSRWHAEVLFDDLPPGNGMSFNRTSFTKQEYSELLEEIDSGA